MWDKRLPPENPLFSPAVATASSESEQADKSRSSEQTSDVVLPELSSASDLAHWVHLPVDVVEPHLRQYREKYQDCYVEVESTRRNDPQFLYRTSEVLPDLKTWTKIYKQKNSRQSRKQTRKSRTDTES
jgi:hypothetical protein